jgi:hypothetical protein
MTSFRERTIPTERPPIVGEVGANSGGWRGMSRAQRGRPLRLQYRFSRPGPLLFF